MEEAIEEEARNLKISEPTEPVQIKTVDEVVPQQKEVATQGEVEQETPKPEPIKVPQEKKQINENVAPTSKAPEPVQIKPTPQPQPQQSSGWGWGGLWSAATSVVDQYVKPTVSTISDTVRELVVDDPQETNAPQLYRREDAPTNTPTPNTTRTNATNNEDNFLSVVDKGFTMLGDGVDMLGGFLGKGLNKVAETANIDTDGFQNMAKDYAVSSYNMAKQVASNTTQQASNLGERIAFQSVDALESVGKKALGYLTVEEISNDKTRIRPVFNYVPQVTQMTKEEQESFEDVLNRNYFDENHGTAYLQELEKLSIECTLKYQKVEQKLSKLDAQHREEVLQLLNKVKEMFDEESEDKKMEAVEVELNEPATKQQAAIDRLAQEGAARAQEILMAFKEELKELRPDGAADSIINSTDVCHLTASYMDKALLESVKRLSHFSAASVEQLLRIVESYLIDADTKQLSQDDAIKRVAFAYTVSNVLYEELNTLSNAYIDVIKALNEAGNNNSEELGKKGEDELSESKKCIDDLDTKANLHVNHVYLDTSNAISNVEECRKFLFPICKSLATSSITLPE